MGQILKLDCLSQSVSSARAYADHGDPYLAVLAGVKVLVEQVRQIWN